MPIVCGRCGQENPDGFTFCGNCAAPLTEAAPPREVRKTVTVLFADVSGSTALGEQRDPEAVRAVMARWFEQARTILERHGGAVEKFIGDAVMAVFGIPQSHEDDALRATRAALELRDSVEEVQLRIGVNTGPVVTGVGETLVTGDAVNVAARLEQAAAPGEILLGAETGRLVRHAAELEAVAPLELKGKSGAVAAYRLGRVDPDAPTVARRLDSPLVGRRRELERLRSDFEHAVEAQTCHLVTLLGTAGVGKSRLVAEFLEGVDAQIVRGRCLPYGEGITYWPVVEVLKQLGTDPDEVIGSSPAETQLAFRHLLEREAEQQALIVLFDDIQWAEPAFLDLIEHVADLSRGVPLFLLCVARGELLDQRPTWGGGKLNATSILLEPLDEQECEALIGGLLHDTTVADETRHRIVTASQGNPLFVEEMLAMLREGGGDSAVPPTIHALLQARLDTLGLEERAVIERGAVEGEVFHRLPVAELTPSAGRDAVDGHLSTLVRKEMIRPEKAVLANDDAYRFRHLLIRDAAYESLPKETRAELHERFAVWLEEHAELVEQDEIVGYHLEQAVLYRRELGRADAGLAERAAERLGRAGSGALWRGDLHASTALLRRATSVAPAESPLRLDLLATIARPLAQSNQLEEAQTVIAELESAGGLWAARAAAPKTMVDFFRGNATGVDAGERAVAAARDQLERGGDLIGAAEAEWSVGAFRWNACRCAAALEHYERAAAFAREAGNGALAREILADVPTALVHGPTPAPVATARLEELLRDAGGSPVSESAIHRGLARLAAMRGDADEARRLMRSGAELLRELGGHVFAAATEAQGGGFIEWRLGDIEAAERALRQGAEELEALGDRAFGPTARAMLAWLLAIHHRDDEAREQLAIAAATTNPEDTVNLAGLAGTEAILEAHAGRIEAAEDAARRALEITAPTDFYEMRADAHEAAATAALANGERERAREHLALAIGEYERKQDETGAARLRFALTDVE